jgi:CRISPR-associated protein (TIGR03986 family)
MAKVSAPYNFVPLNENVFFPPWANLVNHDVPFENGLSGQIKLEIKAETPIFIRKPYEEGDLFYTNSKGDKISKEFCNIKDKNGKKQYYIPGSSIRNMLRSVVEIMGFGKLNPDEYTDRRFGIRDFNNLDVYTLLEKSESIRIGYLIKDDNNYVIYDKGIPVKINQDKIKFNYNGVEISLKQVFDKNSTINFAKKTTHRNGRTKTVLKSEAKTAKFKYEKTKLFLNSANGGYVFTGQPAFNNLEKGKQNEFKIERLDVKNDVGIQVSKELFNDFKFIYGDYEGSTDMSTDWKMWKNQLKKGKAIPVFFRLENNLLEDFGLAFLYKMAYKNRIEKAIANGQRDYNHLNYDLPQVLFGSVNDKKLKGRIHINHAFSNTAKIDNQYKIVLASPKASYYPYYIEQKLKPNNDNYKIDGKYTTYHNSYVKIRGRKRYPLHEINLPNEQEQQRLLNNVSTWITPLKKNAVFDTIISFHNLLPAELGALLSAITFHNNNNCRHTIGAAKPFGLGQIQITPSIVKLISNNNEPTSNNIIDYLKEFENKISQKIKNWANTIQLREFFTMASIQAKKEYRDFKYLKLREFPEIKNEKKALPLYSKMVKSIESAKSLIETIDVDLTEPETISHLISKINKKINTLNQIKYNKSEEYELNEGDYLGTVKFFNIFRGFGFITERETGEDYFIHQNNLVDKIKEKNLVIFNIIKGKKGHDEAYRVEIFDKNNIKHTKQ